MKSISEHLWVSITGNKARIGVTAAAQKELGEVVYIDFPPVGGLIEKGEELAVVESTKAAVDLYSPVSGEVIAINEELEEDVTLLSKSPEEKGWLCIVELKS